MPPRKSSAAKEETPQRTGRRLRLLDHLSDGAFDDQNLQDASAKIARLSQNRLEPVVEEVTPPSGEITDSITDSSTASPIQSPIQSPIGKSVKPPIHSPNEKSETSPNESPIHSPNETTATDLSITSSPNVSWEPVLLTENQATLYVCLKQIQGAVTSLTLISQATKISEHTLKSALKKLREHGLIVYGGRKNSGGRFGFTAQAIERPIILRGNRARLQSQLYQIDINSITLSTSLSGIEAVPGEPEAEKNELELSLSHLMNHRFSASPLSSSSSSKNKLLLQDVQRSLLLEEHFQDLEVRSLEPYLHSFETMESLQIFLDMANAVITAAKDSTKPIQNPKGFLIAQLKAGYINPPEGYKSRRVRAQESRNEQLQAELADLQLLKAEEEQLRFEIFKARLTAADQERLEQEAKARIDRRSPASVELQIEMAQAEILSGWFTAGSEPAAE